MRDPSPPSSIAWLEKLAQAAVNLLFPPHCVACHRFGAWLCAACVNKIETIGPPVCPRCGMPSEQALATAARDDIPRPECDRCRSTRQQIERLRAYAFHSGPLREAIHQFKYQDLRALAAGLGQLMADGWTTLAPNSGDVDVIVPVPLHPTRERQRGYNQSALLARELGVHLERPVVEDTLLRVKATPPQVGLGTKARQVNVRGAFDCTDSILGGKRVLLVDDVCTSGSTLEAASAALRNGGVRSIWAYTLARARGTDRPSSI